MTYLVSFLFLIGSFLLRLDHCLFTYTKHIVIRGTYPIYDFISLIEGAFSVDCMQCRLFGMELELLNVMQLIKCIVDDWFLYCVIFSHMLHLICSQKVSNNRKYVRLRKRILKQGRNLVLCYV